MDITLFFALNRWAGYGLWTDYVGWFLARNIVIMLIALLTIRWFWSGPDRAAERRRVILAVVAMLIAMGVCQIPSDFFYRPRPVIALPGAFSLTGEPAGASSFPSTHSGAKFAITIVAAWGKPRWGALLWTLTMAASGSRVYVGMHYPSDVIAGAVIGLLVGLSLLALKEELRPALDRVVAILSPGSGTSEGTSQAPKG